VHAAACTVLDSRPVAVTAGGDRTVRIWIRVLLSASSGNLAHRRLLG
jgi:hypothetical protein